MIDPATLITEHLDTWTSAIKAKSSAGRGGGKKSEFYGIKKLRELILDLAVRGLLVPQNPKDEPASSAVKKVRLEIELAIAEGRIKKGQLPPKTNQRVVSKLPNGWTNATLPEVANPVPYSIKRGPFGSSIKKDMFVSSGYKVYEQQHAIYGDFSAGTYYLSEGDFRKLEAFELKPSDVVISCSGTVGRVAIAPEDLEPGVINQALLKISLHPCALLNEYFQMLFPAYFMGLDTLSDLQGTAQKNMPGMPVMKSLVFPLPPLAEQHRIVAKVDELMALCDQLEQQQEDSVRTHGALVETLLGTLTAASERGAFVEAWQRIASHFDTLFTTESSIDQLKQTILQLAVMGKLVEQEPADESAAKLLARNDDRRREVAEDDRRASKDKQILLSADLIWNVPDRWIWRGLADVVLFVDYRGKTPTKLSSGVRLLTAKNVRRAMINLEPEEFISEEEYKRWMTRGFPNNGDVLFTTEAPMGNAAVIELTERFALAQRVICFQNYGALDPKFLVLQILSEPFQRILEENGTGMTAKGIKATKLKRLPVAVPPVAEQRRIVAKVDELMALCDRLKARQQSAQATQLHLADTLVEAAIH